MTTLKKKGHQASILKLVRTLQARHHCGWGLFVLLGVLIALSLLAGANFETSQRVYVAGQIADRDVIADRDILVEDVQATKARHKQVMSLQPPVYDLSLEPYAQFQGRILDILRGVGGNDPHHHESENEHVQRLREELTPPVAREVLPELALPEVQTCIIKQILPLVREQMADGLVGDVRSARIGRSGVIIHNLDADTETLRPEVNILPDVQSFLAEISMRLRQDPTLNPQSRRAINILLATTVTPSLTLNREATQKRASAVMETVAPVYYQIQKGELVLRKGERVSREQQLKMQTLYRRAADPMHWDKAAGALLCSLIISIGFFVAPSGRPGTPLYLKDILLISLLLFLFSAGAKCMYLFALHMDGLGQIDTLAIAYPMTCGVGLVAMVFAAKRYCTMGLLLSFHGTLMFQASWPLFIYHFLGGMLFTWLVASAQSRQDAVWSLIPLVTGQILIWLGVSLLAQTNPADWPMHMTAAAINSFISLALLFAISPVLELSFGYSTRFRLMELMSLEQPLMQELMVTAPGTYHHSLIVANMVEAGASAIGANSLLCKVAALYHDIGKLTYPEYFIENQFGGPNRHDRLAPSMSALILHAHVKKGGELAKSYRLGQEIADIIRQHHGTRVMRFFYQKALELDGKANESDFCYPGPRPQTKESAILMLADSVEASSRTLADPTPARLKTHIDTIVKGIFSEGQLDESELTFKDLHYLSENFHRILTGIFHQRIAYPEAKLNIASRQANIPKSADRTSETSERGKSAMPPGQGAGKPASGKFDAKPASLELLSQAPGRQESRDRTGKNDAAPKTP